MTAPILRAVRIGLFALAVVGAVGWDLPTLLVNRDVYRPLAAELAAYLTLLAVAAVGAWVVLRDRPWRGTRWPLVGAVLAACALGTAAVPPADLLGPAHWSWELAPWFCVALLVDRPVRWLAVVLVVHLGILVAQLGAAGRLDREAAVQLAVVGLLNAGGALALGLAGGFARRVADTAARMAAQEAELATANRIAVELHADRQKRYAEVDRTVVPLLEGLHSGALSPADPDVRRRCAVEAARLRRLMAESDDVTDELAHELRACADVAQRAGIEVQLSVRGDRPPLALTVRRALTDPVTAVLAGARSSARLTLVGAPGQVVVSVVADADPATVTDLATTDLATTTATPGVAVDLRHRAGRAWLTVTWVAA